MQQIQRATDWYDLVCQQLDLLRADAHKYADEDDVIPSDGMFDFVKQQMQDIRQLADFPAIPVPDVWLGPDGQIGLTWEMGKRKVELIFSAKKLTARLTDDLQQQLIDKKDVPLMLAQLAA